MTCSAVPLPLDDASLRTLRAFLAALTLDRTSSSSGVRDRLIAIADGGAIDAAAVRVALDHELDKVDDAQWYDGSFGDNHSTLCTAVELLFTGDRVALLAECRRASADLVVQWVEGWFWNEAHENAHVVDHDATRDRGAHCARLRLLARWADVVQNTPGGSE